MAVTYDKANQTAGLNSDTRFNTELTKIQAAFQDCLSRSGTAPNAMSADIDMGDNDILNVGAIDVVSLTVDGAPVPALSDVVAAQTAAETARDLAQGYASDAETSAAEAAASAAGVNLPSVTSGAAGKTLRVTAAEDGFELVKMTAPAVSIVSSGRETADYSITTGGSDVTATVTSGGGLTLGVSGATGSNGAFASALAALPLGGNASDYVLSFAGNLLHVLDATADEWASSFGVGDRPEAASADFIGFRYTRAGGTEVVTAEVLAAGVELFSETITSPALNGSLATVGCEIDAGTARFFFNGVVVATFTQTTTELDDLVDSLAGPSVRSSFTVLTAGEALTMQLYVGPWSATARVVG